ncbi:hypothetical protein G5B40_06660 [Pikeienuella piscinae]|uniref:Tetratricopeptide repeat protein n=1 Tax=Pikeienuella piscinae TaxID=2748098 RepID=A0A7L5BWE0_9RHOB|nr:multiheme c-type cytochrome [Pikeienuella piscinae]QIE55158.1 hypothetical protein G5B40_06660 [Pikeienuella piscinae]
MRHLVHLLVVLFVVAAAPATGQKTPGYVGSDACTGCHTGAAEAWAGSHHALAWTEASPETVVADFDGTQFALDGMTAQFRTDGETYDVEVTETDGTTTDYPVHSVAGIEPLQQYLLETEPGRLQSFDVVWDTEREEWYHLYPDQDLPPDDALHWTGPYKTWNARCAECHATGYDKNYDATTQTYASTEVEIGVGCEACHGPGSEHVAWAEIADSGADLGAYGFTVDFDDTEAAIQQCAGCHSRREPYGDGNPIPGTPYHDAYNLSLLRPGLYHADGQILDEVYVYGSFLQSKMFEAGVGCTDCHEPHTAELVTEGNAVCTQCHSPAGREEFPAAAGEYDTPAHHFHEEGSEAAQCVSCHMTDRAYMGVDWRRDHSFRIPRPDLAATTGAPDACTTCHEDREPDWGAERIAEWFPDPVHRGPHYGETLARGREDAVSAAGELADLAADESQPGIVRATALWLLEQANSPSTAERLAPLLQDHDPLVRAAAAGLQRTAPPMERLPRLAGLLDDPSRSVRIAAARQFLDAPIARLPDEIATDFAAAMNDWQGALASRLDFPETHLQSAGMALTLRNFPAATSAFRETVHLDPQRTDAWVMLVRIAAATEGVDAARAVLFEALEANPQDTTLRGIASELPPP